MESDSRENLRAFVYYLLIVAVIYVPVVLGGKSLVASLYQPHGLTDGGAYSELERTPANTYSVDLATPAYYEAPVNKFVGDSLWRGELPLWNPYQSGGAPLLAQYSTRALFPYQMLEDISPVWSWDFYMLGRLVVAGFFTFLFLRLLGLGFTSAFTGGVFYIFSGAFSWFINLEQLANVAMMAPVLFYVFELLLKKATLRRTAFSAVVIALALLAGQPETTFYLFVVGGLYFVVRLLTGDRESSRLRPFVLVSISLLLGLMLAAPLLLPFLELWSNSHHIHPAGGIMGTQSLVSALRALPILTPSATVMVQDPSMVYGLCQLTHLGGEFFRFLPVNGTWDSLGGFSGVLAVFLSITGLVALFRSMNEPLRAPLIFFFSAGLFIILKNIGVAPFLWLGELPLFDQVWSLRWAGPVWCFALAVSAAIGMEALGPKSSAFKAGERAPARLAPRPTIRRIGAYLEQKPSSAPLLVFFVIALLYAVFALMPTLSIISSGESFFGPRMAPYVIPSIGGAVAVFFVVLVAGALLACGVAKGRRGALTAIAALAALELWWGVPRGYGPEWLAYKWIPFGVGLLLVFFLYARSRTLSILAALSFVAAFFFVDHGAPRGMPERVDPFEPPPYVEFLRTEGKGFRAMGAHGALFPNFASAVGVEDVRYVSALQIDSFQRFRTKYLHADALEEEPVSSLWFTGRPERCFVEGGDSYGRGRYSTWYRPVEDDILASLPAYAMLGVKYLVVPAYANLEQAFPLVYSGEVSIYELPSPGPRAFVAGSIVRAESFEEAQDLFVGGGFGSASTVAIEGEDLPDFKPRSTKGSRATVTEHSSRKVVVEADSPGGGLLVLADTFYPGWKVRVDGEKTEIFRVNGLVRGVFIEAGKRRVEFTYTPASFIGGALLTFISLLVCVIFVFSRRLQETSGALKN